MSEIINKQITDGNYDQSLAVKCINGTFVGKKSEQVITYKGIPFVDQMFKRLCFYSLMLITRDISQFLSISIMRSSSKEIQPPV